MPVMSTVNGTCGALAPKRAFTFAKAPVIGFLSVASGTSLTIPITAPADTGGYPVIDYTITSNPATTTKTTSSAGNYTFTGLTPGTLYTFTVKARTAYGTSSDSTNFGLSGSLAPDAVPDTMSSTITYAYEGLNSVTCYPATGDHTNGFNQVNITYSGTRPTSYTGRLYTTDNGSGSPYIETAQNVTQDQINNNQYSPNIIFPVNWASGFTISDTFKSASFRSTNAYGSSGWSTPRNFQTWGSWTSDYARYPFGIPGPVNFSVDTYNGQKYWSVGGSLNEGLPYPAAGTRWIFVQYSSDNSNWYYYDGTYYENGYRYFYSGYQGYYYRGFISNKYGTSSPSASIYVS